MMALASLVTSIGSISFSDITLFLLYPIWPIFLNLVNQLSNVDKPMSFSLTKLRMVIFLDKYSFIIDILYSAEYVLYCIKNPPGVEDNMNYILAVGWKSFRHTIKSSGVIDIDVYQNENKNNYLYKGRDIPSSSFQIMISKISKYQLRVNANEFIGILNIEYWFTIENAARMLRFLMKIIKD